jgi:hypothetical protein
MASYEFVNLPLFLPLLAKPYHDPAARLEQYPLLASTLAGFPTNDPEPRWEHKTWLKGFVGQRLNALPGSWIYLRGHASARGDTGANMDLSERRKQRVAAEILQVAPAVKRCDGVARGELDSGLDQRDNSGTFRSVELMVYGPDVPMPDPWVLTEPRLVYRETFQVREYTDGPDDPSDPFPIFFYKRRKEWNDVNGRDGRIAQHPCESDDPDFGQVTASRMADVDSSLVLVSVTIDKVEKEYPPIYGGSNIHRSEFTRRYTFSYGRGQWGQKVIVFRNTTYISRTGAVETWQDQPSYVDQPPSYLDP